MATLEVASPALVAAPEPGQLARVRGRMWVVADVARDSQAHVDGRVLQHLVSLISVEDDATGEELEVIWEIEPGTEIIERAQLPEISPDRLDDPAQLEAFLDAVRWGAVTSADQRSLQAPFRSGVVIEDYQLEPLVRALRMPRTTLLVADDVGLGKTIETGLVIQELFLRHRARTALVVCPAGKDDAAQLASHVRVAAVRDGGDPAVRDGSDGPHDRVADAVRLRERDGSPGR